MLAVVYIVVCGAQGYWNGDIVLRIAIQFRDGWLRNNRITTCAWQGTSDLREEECEDKCREVDH